MTRVHDEMEKVSKLRSNLDPLEKNYETRKLELTNLEKCLQTKTAELDDVTLQIQESTKVLKLVEYSI